MWVGEIGVWWVTGFGEGVLAAVSGGLEVSKSNSLGKSYSSTDLDESGNWNVTCRPPETAESREAVGSCAGGAELAGKLSGDKGLSGTISSTAWTF